MKTRVGMVKRHAEALMISKQRRLLHVISVIIMSFSTMSAYAEGADVIAHLKTGQVLSGELYVVGDDSLVIRSDAKEDSLVRDGYATLSFSDLQGLTVKGKSYIAVGVVGGIVGGAAIGGVVGGNSAGNENDVLGLNKFAATLGGGLLGGVIGGFLVGPIIGNALSRADIHFTAQTPGGFRALMQFARVKEGRKP